MGVEIERKYRVVCDDWRQGVSGTVCRQGYLSIDPDRTVRVRMAGGQAWLTIKGRSTGAVRAEYEFAIPPADAEPMLQALCLRPLIEKTRYRVPVGDLVWEVDEFAGENAGLIIAEVELESAARQPELPAWVGEEVTDDPRYYNASLVDYPYTRW